MSLYLYDTRGRRKAAFKSLEPGVVKIYTCGPTVYADAHIGNYRTYIFEDLLRRTLKLLGYHVVQVMNLTDVEDKTIREANERNVSLEEFTEPIIERFFADLDLLNIERAEYYPRATKHIPEMIALVGRLLDKGFAYIADGSVYFRISKFPQYGQLSGMKLNSLKAGVRIDADEYERDDFRDFALWKGWTEADGEVGWNAPFGRGRPGWHIECSAMSMKYLGEEFDLHTGGVDNIFPHHENEIAQSVAATGKRFASYWIHSAHLIVDGEKMSKSLGNMFMIKDLLTKGYSPRSIRYALLSTHYRQQLNFTDELVHAASSALERLDTMRFTAEVASTEGVLHDEIDRAIHETRSKFVDYLKDDLNISAALGSLFELVTMVHRYAREKSINASDGRQLLGFWREADSILGVLFPKEVGITGDMVNLVRERLHAKREKDFAKADRIREILSDKGYRIEDLPDGSTAITGSEGREIVKYGN